MTFGNYILSVRRRLQDLRTPSGVLITAAITDGIRWSGVHLQEVCNSALQESTRLIYFYFSSKGGRQNEMLGETLIIEADVVTIATGVGDLVAEQYFLTSVDDGTNIYAYKKPNEFRRIQLATSLPRTEGKYYTVEYDETIKRIIKIQGGANGAYAIKYVFNKHDYTIASNNATELHIIGMDDFILDIAEKEAREREGNLERARILENRIVLKLGLAGGRNAAGTVQ
uniref:Uncharacterized protein n=1 Tax=viral metagenome TaxID=1070528 RepID=A0A6H1ZG03_9ZZZZ